MSGEIPKCIDCEAEIFLPDGTTHGEIIICPECGVELEIKKMEPVIIFQYAPKEAEDWGE